MDDRIMQNASSEKFPDAMEARRGGGRHCDQGTTVTVTIDMNAIELSVPIRNGYAQNLRPDAAGRDAGLSALTLMI